MSYNKFIDVLLFVLIIAFPLLESTRTTPPSPSLSPTDIPEDIVKAMIKEIGDCIKRDFYYPDAAFPVFLSEKMESCVNPTTCYFLNQGC
nr:hypothetical protein Iba_chr14eCG7090 [Ipomoea batatas]